MPSKRRKSILVAAGVILIASFTLLSALSFGFYLNPYEHPDRYHYDITHESSQEFEETLEGKNLDADDAILATELSPQTRQAFQTLTNSLPKTDPGRAGWESGDIDICRDSMLVCDGFAEPPTFPSHDSASWTTYTLIEQDGEVYLVESFGPTNIPFIWATLFSAPAIVVFSALLMLVGIKYRNAPTTGVYSMAMFGVIIGLWPYIVMFARIERYWLSIFPLTCIGIVFLLHQLRYLVRRDLDQVESVIH